MRPVDRIDRILQKVKAYWLTNSDQRFWQMLTNLLSHAGIDTHDISDPFLYNKEDDFTENMFPLGLEGQNIIPDALWTKRDGERIEARFLMPSHLVNIFLHCLNINKVPPKAIIEEMAYRELLSILYECQQEPLTTIGGIPGRDLSHLDLINKYLPQENAGRPAHIQSIPDRYNMVNRIDRWIGLGESVERQPRTSSMYHPSSWSDSLQITPHPTYSGEPIRPVENRRYTVQINPEQIGLTPEAAERLLAGFNVQPPQHLQENNE